LGALLLQKQKIPNPNTQLIANTLLEAVKQRGIENLPWSDAASRTRQRLAYLHQFDPLTWPDVSENALIETIEDWLGPHLYGLKSMDQVNKLDLQEILLSDLAWEKRQVMDRVAPTHLDVPSGSKIQLDYSNPSTPVLAVRLQEVFGMLETPCIGNGKTPLLMHLLSPASRPVQVTRDLKSFWATGYFDVRKDLRGRYPKHHWPENPLDAIPSRGIKRKPSK
jgi:ATP-dependent helicase HrpB